MSKFMRGFLIFTLIVIGILSLIIGIAGSSVGNGGAMAGAAIAFAALLFYIGKD